MTKKVISDIEVSGSRVLIRVDFNVPLDSGSITDDRRIRMALPTIESVLTRGGRAILMSHLGRPAGTGFEQGLSLAPVAARLTELLGAKVRRPVVVPSQDPSDTGALEAANQLADGEALLLENLRFNPGEKKGDPDFAEKLAKMGDVYCNNAFGTCHRADASMVGLPQAMSGRPLVCGDLVEREIRFLSSAVQDPKRPFVVVLGGAKVSDKLGALKFLAKKADTIVVGGAMAYTFLKAQGTAVGASRVEADMLDEARELLSKASDSGCEVLLPIDHMCSTAFDAQDGKHETFEGDIEEGYMGLDIGPKTRDRFAEVIQAASTVVWNGPMGVFEWPLFSVGTRQVAEACVVATKNGAVTVVGGGDSAAAAEQFGVASNLSHVSTGGGASLAMLSGQPFESVELLDNA